MNQTYPLPPRLQSLVTPTLQQPGGSPADGGPSDRRERGNLLASLTKARGQLAAAKVKSSIELVDGILEREAKVILFSCFNRPEQALPKHFGEACVVLNGETPSAKRQALVDRFQTEPGVRVFVANLVAGGVGLNQTAASQVVFNDLEWVPANHWQGEDRAYRIGQTGTVNVHYFVHLNLNAIKGESGRLLHLGKPVGGRCFGKSLFHLCIFCAVFPFIYGAACVSVLCRDRHRNPGLRRFLTYRGVKVSSKLFGENAIVAGFFDT